MEVPSRQFPSELVNLLQLIADSHFVALDLEFSGIYSRRTGGGRSRLSLQQVYEEVREAATQYQILQVGLTIVEEDAQKGTSRRVLLPTVEQFTWGSPDHICTAFNSVELLRNVG